MSVKFCIVNCVLLTASFLPSASAGRGTNYGDEKWLWESSFLIVARVSEVRAVDPKKDHDSEASHILTLEPLATIAGHLDPSQQAGLQVSLYTDPFGSTVFKAPKKGALILAVICPGNVEGDENRPNFCVSPEVCRFMPDKAGYVVVHDMADKIIYDTMKKLREIRHTDAEVTTRPSQEEKE